MEEKILNILSEIKERQLTMEGDIAEMKEKQTAMEENIAEMSARQTTMEENIVEMNARQTAMEENIAEMNAKQTAVESNITDLKKKQDKALKGQNSIKKLVNSLNSQVQIINTNLLFVRKTQEKMETDLEITKGNVIKILEQSVEDKKYGHIYLLN